MKNKTLYRYTHIITFLTIIHGLFFYIIKGYFQIETDYGIRPHPYQAHAQAIHIVLSPLWIFIFGVLFKDHILEKLKNSKFKKLSGVSSVVFSLLMVLSGYLVQIIYEPSLKEIVVNTHLVTSSLFSVFYFIHIINSKF